MTRAVSRSALFLFFFVYLVLNNHGVSVEPHVIVVDVKEAVVFKVRVELDVVEALLNKGGNDDVGDIKERAFQHFTIVDNSNNSMSFYYENTVGSIFGDRYIYGVNKATCDLNEFYGDVIGEFAARLGDLVLCLGNACESYTCSQCKASFK